MAITIMQYVDACKIKAEYEALLLSGGAIQTTELPLEAPAQEGADDWFSPVEAADYLKKSKRTVSAWVKSGRLKQHGTGKGARIKRSACDRALKK